MATDPGPNFATTGSRTTAMAPVGPDTWRSEPPKTPATSPATMAVIRPTDGLRPAEMAKASASGRATTPTVIPATTSPLHEARTPR